MKVEKIGAVLEMGRNKIEMEKVFYGCKGRVSRCKRAKRRRIGGGIAVK